jgi:RNA polymerase sigma-70 factor (ECF subfamily)
LFETAGSDAQLVARSRGGELEAFNTLVSRWEKRLYNYLLRLLSSRAGFREDALDLCQETFLKAYQSIDALEDAEKFSGWLYRIAHNLAYSEMRRPALVQSLDEHFSDDGLEDGRGGECIPIRSSIAWSMASGSASRELKLSVSRALDTLPEEQREAIVLKVYHGFIFQEIAEITSTPLSTVKTRIYAGFAALRTILGERTASIPRSHERLL